MRRSLTRRSFLGIAAATAAAAALPTTAGMQTALAEVGTGGGAGEVEVVRSCCRACGKMECGVLVSVSEGRVVKIEGDPSSFQHAI